MHQRLQDNTLKCGQRFGRNFRQYDEFAALLAGTSDAAVHELVAFKALVSFAIKVVGDGEMVSSRASDTDFVGSKTCSGACGVVVCKLHMRKVNLECSNRPVARCRPRRAFDPSHDLQVLLNSGLVLPLPLRANWGLKHPLPTRGWRPYGASHARLLMSRANHLMRRTPYSQQLGRWSRTEQTPSRLSAVAPSASSA